jgi:hypothetical protein
VIAASEMSRVLQVLSCWRITGLGKGCAPAERKPFPTQSLPKPSIS